MLSHYWRPALIDYFETNAKEARVLVLQHIFILFVPPLRMEDHENIHIILQFALKPQRLQNHGDAAAEGPGSARRYQ